MTPKRLFLFAAYTGATKCVSASLLHYLGILSQLGDVILYMDNDCPANELEKLSPYVLFADATRHGEYDFGSYKRAYNYAKENNLLNNYDFVYMVNDSVYGPLRPIDNILRDIESKNLDAFGIVKNPHHTTPHIQSWFIGMNKTVFLSTWFNSFITGVKKQPTKELVTHFYENGFTKLLIKNNLAWDCVFTIRNRDIYNRIKFLYRRHLPFIKKNAFIRHGGAIGRQLFYVLNHINPDIKHIILQDARLTYGNRYICWLLTQNPIKIAYRNIKYFLHKIGG